MTFDECNQSVLKKSLLKLRETIDTLNYWIEEIAQTFPDLFTEEEFQKVINMKD